MPIPAEMTMSFDTYCVLWQFPGWADVLALPQAEKRARLRDPAVRAELEAAARTSRLSYLGDFANYRIGETVSPENEGLEGRRVGDLAAERGIGAFDCLVDIVLLDDCKTVLWPVRTDAPEDWERRRSAWADDDVMLGGSDAGAHLDRRLASHYQAAIVNEALHGRSIVSLERAVQMVTSLPAGLFGLRDRGALQVGNHADVVVLDPDRLGSGPIRRIADLPAGGVRLFTQPDGIRHVFVNGREAVVDGEPTGVLAGRVLRSGRDTDTVPADAR
jgi:N-acyl-D-aspartate/D-glutamate deacylase